MVKEQQRYKCFRGEQLMVMVVVGEGGIAPRGPLITAGPCQRGIFVLCSVSSRDVRTGGLIPGTDLISR